MKINISSVVDPDLWEVPYLINVLNNIKNDFDDNYNFIIARTNNQEEIERFKVCIDNDKKNILILISDELGINNVKNGPYFMKDYIHMIFRTYNNSDLYDEKWIFPIPCGYSHGINGHHTSNGKRVVLNNFEEKTKKLKDRKYDVFFSGANSGDRMHCISQANKLSNKFKKIINPTKSFGNGFSLNEYYKIMKDSKIALVPLGAVIPESFRFFEACESNCIIISTYPIKNKKYNTWYYRDSPAIFIESWSDLNDKLIDDLLKNKKLELYNNLNKKYFDENISTKGLSNYIKNKIIEYEK